MPTQDWFQKILQLPTFTAGMHPLDKFLKSELPEIQSYEHGFLHLFLQHTSASLVINENADPHVGQDLLMALDRLAPQEWPYKHQDEGPDDMPAHIKTMLAGHSLQIPIMQGELALGTWQGIFLCEHRAARHQRRVVATLFGERRG